MTEKPSFVAFDMASLFVISRAGLDRCIETAVAAHAPGARPRSSGAMLGEVYAAFDRVLTAHVAHDAFVSERTGTRVVLERLFARGVPILAAASFSRPVAIALARRFRWNALVELEARTRSDGSPLYRAVERAARERGWRLDGAAFVSDDRWELEAAANAGCSRIIAFVDPGEPPASPEHGVTFARSTRELLAHLLPSDRVGRAPSRRKPAPSATADQMPERHPALPR